MTNTTPEDNRYVFATVDNVPESIHCVPQFYTAYPQMNVDQVDPVTGTNGTIQSSQINESSSSNETTTFNTDGIAVSMKNLMTSYLPRLFTSSSDLNNSQDIKSFLAKPILIDSDFLSSADVTSTPVSTWANPSLLITNAMVASKLAGYMGIRATTCLRLVVNASPFQQGRYMLCHVPTGGHDSSSVRASNFINAHVNTLFERTQLTRVEFDLTCDTEAILRIPFSSVFNYYPLRVTSEGLGSLGKFFLYAYSPLEDVSGAAVVSYSLYAHFEDVELIGACQPQMGTPSEKESNRAGQGPVSSVLLGFSKAASIVAEVPMLSSFASTASWALDIAGRSAKAAGFSKPPMLGPVTRVINGSSHYLGNTDGFDSAQYLSATSNPSVSTVSGFAGTDIDEMSISYIASIPAWFGTLDWDPENSGGTLASIELTPSYFAQSRTFSTLVVENLTPVAMIGKAFHSWRGSLVFTFKFVKTIYHSGRLALTFVPRTTDISTIVYDPAYANYLHREIVDIRKCNEITITVPYVGHNPFLGQGESFGQLVVSVVDNLVSPANVPSNVSILMEVSGGPDIEFARPLGRNTLIGGIQGTVFLGATPQMGDPCEIADTMIGSSSIVASSTINAEMCIGEKVTSLRSLLKIAKVQRFQSAVPAGAIASISPFLINSVHWTSTPVLTYGYALGDLYDILGACYLFSRGGMCLKENSIFSRTAVLEIGTSSEAPSGYFTRAAVDLFGRSWSLGSLAGGKFAYAALGGNNAISEWNVPQYSHRHSRNNIGLLTNPVGFMTPATPAYLGSSIIVNMIEYFVTSPTSKSYPLFRSVGDDFSFGGFISTVPIHYNSVATNI